MHHGKPVKIKGDLGMLFAINCGINVHHPFKIDQGIRVSLHRVEQGSHVVIPDAEISTVFRYDKLLDSNGFSIELLCLFQISKNLNSQYIIIESLTVAVAMFDKHNLTNF